MIIIKKITLLLTISVVTLFCFTPTIRAETAAFRVGTSNLLITSHDPERYASLIVQGDTIYIEGYFKEDKIKDFYIDIPMSGAESQSLKINSDGTFNGHFGGIPLQNAGNAVLVFNSGASCSYRVDFDGSKWFFSVNGFDRSTYQNIKNHTIVSDEASAYYVCEDLDIVRTRETLDEVRRIAFEVTDGIDDDYAKAKALSVWVSRNIYYDYAARDTEVNLGTVTLENVLKTKRTVCTGYANLYAALLEAVGITAVNIQGGVVSAGKCTYEQLADKTVKHEWVAFKYEAQNRWIYTDVVWDSGNYFNNNRYIDGNLPMKYFDIDGLTLSLDHRGDKAELRNYMSANDYVQGIKVKESETTTENTEAKAETTAQNPRGNNLPDVAAENDYNPDKEKTESEDNTLLIIAVGILSLGVIIAGILLIKQLKGK